MKLPPRQYPPAPGPDDFRQLRERGYHYVDKSAFVEEWLRSPHQVVLLPRPRRFGKTLNLSLLRYYLEKSDEDRSWLFEGLALQRAPAEIRQHQGRYPVVHLSLKDVKTDTYEACVTAIGHVLSESALEHRELAGSAALSAEDHARYVGLRSGRLDASDLRFALRWLSMWLSSHHGAPVVILLDEYDAPIEAGFLHGYYDEIVGFMRGFLGAVLKTNPSLYRGVLTGVRRISKESLFSDLNNVVTRTMLDPAYSSSFGFTEEEVAATLEIAGRSERLPEVKNWYNGYLFGGRTVYNPWSVLSFAESGELCDYWAQTSADALLRRLLLRGDGLQGDFEVLLAGGAIERRIDEQIALRDLDREQGAVWSLLLTAGYLKAQAVRREEGALRVQLAIPNVEVSHVWRRSFGGWLELRLGGEAPLRALRTALLRGEAREVEHLLRPLVRDTLSYHDVGAGPDDAPERVYHAFVLGLLVTLAPGHRVRSNRESGHGRADVLILPSSPGEPGVVLEFKRLWSEDGETPEGALAAAHAQIAARGYRAELEAAGASPVVALAVVFEGKRVWVG